MKMSATDSQDSGSPPPSPSDSATSESAPTLVHIKQENMAPGTDLKDYYGNLDFGIPDTYLPPHSTDYGRTFLHRPMDPNQGFPDPVKSPTDKDDDMNDQNSDNPKYDLPNELVFKSGGIFAREKISSGTEYGPFVGKWEKYPLDKRYAWEVFGKSSCWLDATSDNTNWLKYIRSSNYPHDVNVQHLLQGGQLWYKVIRDIPAGQELLLGPRTFLLLQDINVAAGRGVSRVSTDPQQTEDEEREDTDPRCSFCDAPFPNIDVLDRHLIQAHAQPPAAFHCELCNRAYSSRTLLLRHRALAHTDIRKYPCENCPKAFSDPSNLQRHIRAQHAGARSHACPECGKTFTSSSGLKQHTHIHSSVKPFQCKVCFKSYTQFSNLCRHKRMHAACKTVVECGKCGQPFQTYAALTKHKRFCDTASAGNVRLRGHLPPGLPQMTPLPNVGMNTQNNSNPFPMYRGQALPLPYNTFAHYPALFSAAAAAACPPEFLNPLLFNVQGARLAMEHDLAMNSNLLAQKHQEERMSVKSRDSSTSLDEIKKMKDMELDLAKRDDENIERITPKPQVHHVKHSPSSEENSQHRPSPVLPLQPPVGLFNFANNDVKHSSPYNLTLNHNNNEGIRSIPVSPTIPKNLTKGNTNDEKRYSDNEDEIKKDQGDQPLDLSVGRKQSDKESDGDNDEPKNNKEFTDVLRTFRNTSVKSFSPPESPIERQRKSPENDNMDVDVEGVEPKREDSPQPLVSSPLAFPMPVHPQHNNNLINAMYPPYEMESILSRRFSTHSPYVPSSFNFLSPLLGADGPDQQLSAYAKFRETNAGTGKMRDRYACKFCGKVFPRSANLTRHLRTHTGEQPYKCKYCERSFSISSNLQRHVRNIHNKERPFRCPLCDRCFGQQTNLDRHLKKHEAEGGDSPSSADTEREDAYCDDIRSFVGKVTCSPGPRTPPASSPHTVTPHAAHPSLPPRTSLAVSVFAVT